MRCFGCGHRYKIGQSVSDTDCELAVCPYEDEERDEPDEEEENDAG
jgi:hypothetical protein